MSEKHYNPEAPHQAVILVRWENFERDDLGRCVGRPSTSDSNTYTFVGNTHAEVEEQVQSFLRRIENGEKITRDATCENRGCRERDPSS